MFDNLFLSITVIGEFWFPTVVCALAYWCFDFKAGIYLFSLLSFNIFFTQLFKMLACVYRPWVLSDKIKPVEKAFALAAGYSFPSGHTAKASAVLGGLAFLLKKWTGLLILLVMLVLLVGFSRMWLGVHTPQDVVAGILIGFSLVFIMNFLINWAEKRKDRYLYLFVLTNVVINLPLIYLCYFNNYPTDYLNGKLLVNPLRSLQVSVFCYAYISGLLSGLFLCRRFFPFNPKDDTFKTKMLKGIIGSTLIILLFKMGIKYLFCSACDFKVVYVCAFIFGFFITKNLYYLFSTSFKAPASLLYDEYTIKIDTTVVNIFITIWGEHFSVYIVCHFCRIQSICTCYTNSFALKTELSNYEFIKTFFKVHIYSSSLFL